MTELIRSHRWAGTPLGAIEDWPAELLVAVNLMLTSSQTCCLIWGPDQILLYNDLYTPFLGNKTPALGRPFLEVWSEIREQAAAIIAEPFQTGLANRFERVPFFILLDGELVERICTLSNNPVWSLDEVPRVLGLYQTIVDHTEGELAARELRTERERLREVLAASRDAVTMLDRNWRIVYMNPATLSLMGAETDHLGKVIWDIYPSIAHPDSLEFAHFHRAMNDGIAASFETCYPEPHNLCVVVDVCPTSEGIVIFVRDISNEKKAEAALIQSEKLAAVGRLAASIAHEINNPLESVTNLLYLARSSDQMREVQGYLATAERELHRVSVISNQTLRFYKQSSRSSAVVCAELFDSVLSIYKGRLVNSNIVAERSDRASVAVECYDGEIRQVLSNLIANAMDAMQPGGGRLLIRSRSAHNWKTGQAGVALVVADSGPGMPPEVLARVFEAFYTTKGIGGNGLGLWVSQEIVDRHQGTLRVRSSHRAGQSGTVFVLFLPFHAAVR